MGGASRAPAWAVPSGRSSFPELDRRLMSLAFEEAGKVRGSTYPNPAVGAVLWKDGRIVGRGGTRPPGQAHAEIVALEQAGEEARGATLYVTLEPCCHFGRTPPCSRAVLAAGVARVVVAVSDPYPKVDGGGIRELSQAGVQVEVGLMEEEAREFYRYFFFHVQNGRPMILLKAATGLDGRINARPGERTAISGEAARLWVHHLRSRVDALLIGAGTLRADDPDLGTRLVPGPSPQPLVLTRGGKLPPGASLFRQGRVPGAVVLAPPGASLRGLPPWVEAYRWGGAGSASSEENPDGAAVVRELVRFATGKGYHSLLVEGGTHLWALFLESGCWDRLYLLMSPKMFPHGQRWDEQVRVDWGKSAIFGKFQPLGDDVLLEISNSAGACV